MRADNLRQIGPVMALALGWCLWPTAAAAQAYTCPYAGPGERVVGMTTGGHGVAPVPLCVRDDSGDDGGEAPAGPSAPAATHAVIVGHPDAADVWVEGNYTSANNPGDDMALAACNKAMGGGCGIADTWSNSTMTVIRDRNGIFRNGWMGEDGADHRKALADCSAKQLLPCEVFATIKASTSRRSPGASVRKFYVASAWVTGGVEDGYNSRLYVASGYRNLDEATAAAIKACSDATSRTCEANTFTGNGYIQAYRMNGGDDSATAENSPKRAKEAAQANCEKLKATSCELQAVFDSRKSGLFVHEFAKPKAP
ncbi:MAG: DUF4189 domain-containing protein [Sphingopyxis sp.]|nr:DUF4189 domain-containing protein [Sphingopyxis sp.]